MNSDAGTINPGSKTTTEKTIKSVRKAAQAGPANAGMAARNASKAKADSNDNPWIKVTRRKSTNSIKPAVQDVEGGGDQDVETVEPQASAQPSSTGRSPFAATVEDAASDSEMSDASTPGSANHNRFVIPGQNDIDGADESQVQDAPGPDEHRQIKSTTTEPTASKKAKPKKAKAKGKGKATEPVPKVAEDVFIVQPYTSKSNMVDAGDDGDTEMSDASEPSSPTAEKRSALLDEQADFIDLSNSPIKTRAQRASETADKDVGATSSAGASKTATSKKPAKAQRVVKTSAGGHRPLVAEGAEEWAEGYRKFFTPKSSRVKAVETPASDLAMKQPILVHPENAPATKTPNRDHLPPSSPTLSDMDASPLPPHRPSQQPSPPSTQSSLVARLSRIQSRAPTLTTSRPSISTSHAQSSPDFPATYEAYPGALLAGMRDQQIDAWADAEGHKVLGVPLHPQIATAVGLQSLIAQGTRRWLAERLLYPDVQVKVAAPVADPAAARAPVAHLVYNLPRRVASALLTCRGFTYPDVTLRFAPFDITIPDFLFGISGWHDIDAQRALDLLCEAMTNDSAQATWLSVHEQYGVQEEQAGAFVDSLRVEVLDIRAPGNVAVPQFNFYADGKTLGSDDAWFTVRDTFHRMEYPTLLNGTGLGAEFFECGICLGADHPRGLCPLPDVPGWQGPVRRPNQQNGVGRGQGGFQRGGRGRGFGMQGGSYRGRGQ